MSKRREPSFDPNKFLDEEGLRINLLLASLYLTAFEILKMAIVEQVTSFFVYEEKPTPEEIERLTKNFGDDAARQTQQRYAEQVAEYEHAVGIKYDERDTYGLIPSCRWLQGMEALEEKDVDAVKRIREHRNEIAHELPYLLTSKGSDVDLDLLQKIGEVLSKVEIFAAQSTVLFNAETWEEITPEAISANGIFSGRQIILGVIRDTVVDYLEKVSSSKSVEGQEAG